MKTTGSLDATKKLGHSSKLKTTASSSALTMTATKLDSLKPLQSFGVTKRSTSAPKKELQGPIDWSIRGLKLKYRGEKQREDSYALWLSTKTEAMLALERTGEVLPIIKMERHPLYVWYLNRLEMENDLSNSRTKSRLLMKRFVLDVQEVWLSNLEHLKEHQAKQLFAANISSNKSLIASEEEEEERAQENFMRLDGLENRRDVKEIVGLQHQVQSVSQKKTFEKAYHTARLPASKVKLDYKPEPTVNLQTPKPINSKIESLLSDLSYLKENTENSFLFNDSSICSQFNNIALHLDRLLPSNDIATYICSDVLWRYTLVDTTTLARRVYIVPETTMALYAAEIINSDTSEFSNTSNPTRVFKSKPHIPIPYNDEIVEWEARVDISISTQTFNDDSLLSPLRITITAELSPFVNIHGEEDASVSLSSKTTNYDRQTLILQISPAEVKHTLRVLSAPLFDFDWWSDESRGAEIWELLLCYLRLEAEDSAYPEAQARTPVALVIASEEKRNATINDDLLTPLQAVACAYELMPFTRLYGDLATNVPYLRIQSRDKPSPQLAEVGSIDSSYPYKTVHHPDFRPTSLDWKPAAKAFVNSGRWENLLEQGPNLSLQVNGGTHRMYEVPGSSELGRRGLWFPDQLHPDWETTQVGALYFRDKMKSSTDSILVILTLAMETCILQSSQLAWEAFPQLPIATVGEEVQGALPLVTDRALVMQNVEHLISPIETRLSNMVVIFTASAVETYDYLPRDSIHRPSGFRRHVPYKNIWGFREQVEVSLIFVDPVIDSHVFGVTQMGAIANSPGVNSRNIWHNLIAVNEHINRPRTSKDYHYVVAKVEHIGANIPTSYTTRMKAHEMVGLTSSAFKDFEDAYAKIQELRDVFAKQLALEARIEKVETDLKLKEAMHVRSLQRQLQRALEKKLKKATSSERGWRKRFNGSTLVELQGNWERRKDDRTNLFFFHKITPEGIYKEKFAESCQWEIPAEWDGEIWHTTGNDEDSLASMTQNHSIETDGTFPNSKDFQAAFKEPSSTWHPGESLGGTSIDGTSAFKTIAKDSKKRGTGGKSSGDSDVNSVDANKSLPDSLAPTIDTVNLEHIAEQLLSSDEIMRVLAKRLGIPEEQVVPADELSSVFSVDSDNQLFSERPGDSHSMLNAPRDLEIDEVFEPEFDSDEELWSDDENEVGDFDPEKEISPPEDLPGNQMEAAQLYRREMKQFGDKLPPEAFNVPSQIPYLDFTGVTAVKSHADIEGNIGKYAWRRLPRPALNEGFLTGALKTHVRGPDKLSCNTVNAPVFLLPISPVDACKYIPDAFSMPVESLFVPNAKIDMERSVATLERNIRREEELSKNIPTDELLLNGEAKEFTSLDQFLAKQYKSDQAAVSDPKEAARENALLAAKSTNIALMEDSLAEDIAINTADKFGNTLLILAAQQGSRRMCKFLLRRGANINIQNLSGNTGLHYAYAYGNKDLAEYLKGKGANDSILNVDGLTCYEGLSKESMAETFGDYDEEDYDEEEEDEGDEDEGGSYHEDGSLTTY